MKTIEKQELDYIIIGVIILYFVVAILHLLNVVA